MVLVASFRIYDTIKIELFEKSFERFVGKDAERDNGKIKKLKFVIEILFHVINAGR